MDIPSLTSIIRTRKERPGDSPPAHAHDDVLRFTRKGRYVWQMREDVRRILLYMLDEECRQAFRIRAIHPTEAVILALFDGHRTLAQVEKDVSFLFSIDDSEVCNTVERILNRRKEALSLRSADSSPGAVYDPRKFVLPAGIVDLQTIRLYKPIALHIRVSDDCMRDCIYCNVQKRRNRDVKLLSLQRWEELAEEAHEIGIASITFGGGDPFMRRDIVELIAIFFKQGLPVMASTKSYVSPRRAQRLAEIGVRRMQVSIDAPTPHLADFLTRSPGYFNEVSSSIQNLLGTGIRVRTNTVLTRHNLRTGPDLVEWLIDRGVDIIRLSPYGLSSYVNDGDKLFGEDDDVRWVAKEIDRIRAKHSELDIAISGTPATANRDIDRRQRFESRALCTAGRHGMVVLSDGKVILCEELPVTEFFVVGDLTRQSIMEVWNSPRINDIIRPPRQNFQGASCFKCPQFDECHTVRGRCFRDALKAFGSFYAPAPDCPRAPRGRRLY